MFSKSITVLLCYAKQYEMQRDAACNLFKMSHHISIIAVKEGKHGSGWNNKNDEVRVKNTWSNKL